MGLIKAWIDYFEDIRRHQDPLPAIVKVGENRGRLPSKWTLLMLKLHMEGKPLRVDDIDEYLNQIEVQIGQANAAFSYACHQVIGSFAHHPIFELPNSLTREDYPRFLQICKEQKYIGLISFLDERSAQLEKVLAYLRCMVVVLRLKRDRDLLQEVIQMLEPLVADHTRHRNTKKHVGDVVIALDTPNLHTLCSKDLLHSFLAKGAGKKYRRIS